MYRVRFHGRGGQGIKTASRILGSAFFLEGFEVQDAPRYGAERRGAPVFAYVRADHEPIADRGPIQRPDLVLVADESLLQVAAAGVMTGIHDSCVLVIASDQPASEWRQRLAVSCTTLTLPPDADDNIALMGAASVGAAATLLGCISRDHLVEAMRLELEGLPASLIERNIERAQAGFALVSSHRGSVVEGVELTRSATPAPDWVRLETEASLLAAPDVHGAANSERVMTGLWRTMRPEIDEDRCRRCSWICGTLCPEGAIDVGPNREPIIDYDHCKGCLLCAAVCPSHAIRVEPEGLASEKRS